MMKTTIGISDYMEARDARRAEVARRRRRRKASETAWQVCVAFFPAILLGLAMLAGALAK